MKYYSLNFLMNSANIIVIFLQTVYPYIQLFELQVCSLNSVSQSVITSAFRQQITYR